MENKNGKQIQHSWWFVDRIIQFNPIANDILCVITIKTFNVLLKLVITAMWSLLCDDSVTYNYTVYRLIPLQYNYVYDTF